MQFWGCDSVTHHYAKAAVTRFTVTNVGKCSALLRGSTSCELRTGPTCSRLCQLQTGAATNSSTSASRSLTAPGQTDTRGARAALQRGQGRRGSPVLSGAGHRWRRPRPVTPRPQLRALPGAAVRRRHPQSFRRQPRHAPCPRAARPPIPRPEVASPHRGQSGDGARCPPAAPGPRPLGWARPRRPRAARFWGRALLRGGSPRGRGGEAGERGGGRGEGPGRRGERGREGGPNPERERRGEGEKQKGKKGPESAPRCGLRATSPRPAWSSARPALLASLLPVCASPRAPLRYQRAPPRASPGPLPRGPAIPRPRVALSRRKSAAQSPVQTPQSYPFQPSRSGISEAYRQPLARTAPPK